MSWTRDCNEHLEEFLTQSGLTQRAFAQRVGVREATVSAWRSGVRPRPQTMERIERETRGLVPVWSWFAGSITGDPAPASAAE